MQKQGFTLIELLVVIAVIAVLMAILMPSLQAAKEQAGAAVCMNNNKSLGMAWVMYADENNQRIPSAAVWWGIDEKQYGPVWVGPPRDLRGDGVYTVEEEKAGFKDDWEDGGVLWPYIKTSKAYHCPSDKRFSKYGIGYRSYSQPGGLNAGHWGGRFTQHISKVTELRRPSEKYIFVEEAQVHDENPANSWNMGSWVLGIATHSWVDPMAIWHNRGSTFAFADGHAARQVWRDPRTFDFVEKGHQGMNDMERAKDNEDFEFMVKGWPTNEKTR